MKKPFNYTLFAILTLALPVTIARAEVQPGVLAQAQVVSPTKPVAQAKPAVEVIDQSLAARKVATETSLRATEAQFRLFATRTQTTIDRLKAKNIDTTKAQAELTDSLASLDVAKIQLDLFAKIPTPEESATVKELTDTAELKASLQRIQESLAEARMHLIQSLINLKTTVSLSIGAQQ